MTLEIGKPRPYPEWGFNSDHDEYTLTSSAEEGQVGKQGKDYPVIKINLYQKLGFVKGSFLIGGRFYILIFLMLSNEGLVQKNSEYRRQQLKHAIGAFYRLSRQYPIPCDLPNSRTA